MLILASMMRPKRTCCVGVCRACGENISNRIYVHSLFSQFEGQCLKPFDYTTALEDLTGPISQDDALPQIICETCRKLLKRYYKSFCDVEKIGSIFRESAQKQRESHSLAWRTRDPQQGEISITPFPQERMTDACKVTPRDLTVTLVVVPKSENTDEDATPDPNNDNIKPEPAEISVYLEDDMEPDRQSGDDDDASSKLSQVSVPTKYILTGPMEKLVDNILNGQFFSAAKAIMDIPDLASLVTKEVLNQVVKECKELTSVPFNSILRQTSSSSLEAFRWDTVFTEWKTTAPTFLRFLESASTSTWVSAMTKERTQRKNFAIGMAGATLLKVRCGRMSAPMYRNSLIMHQAQKKKCFNRFARLGVCVTKQSMLHLLRRVRASEEVTRTPSAGEDHNYDSVAPRRSTENTDRQEDPEPTATEKQQEPRTSLGEEQLPDSGMTESTTPTVTCTPLFRSKNHGQGPSKCQAKPKPQPQPQHQAQPQPQHQAQHQAQPQPQHQAQPQPQHQAQPQPQHQAQPQAQPQPQHQAQPKPQPQPQPFPTTFLLGQPFQTAQNQTVMLSKQNVPLMIFTLPYVQSPAAQSEEVKGVESTTLHNYNVPCSCQVCGQSFDFTRHLIRHVQMHLAEQNRLCGLCGKVLEPAENMAVHLQTHSLMKTFCHICGKCFPKNSELKYHISIYHYVEKPHLCEMCGKTFRHGKALKEHHTSFHIEGRDKPYKCHLCRKGFSGERQVKLHQLTHTGEKPYQCEDCGMCFREKNTLKGHMRTHTGEKPYKCRECGKCFRLLGALKCHLLTHTGEKPYRCNVCGRCFSQSSSRKTHMKTHKMAHAVDSPQSAERPDSAEKALSE